MVALVLTKKGKPAKGQDKKESKTKKEASEKPKPSPATDKVDKELLGRAVKALLKHHEKQVNAAEEGKQQLLGTDTTIQVQFTLEVVPVRPSRKPFRVDIPHSIYKVSKDETNDELDEPEVCLFVKDGAKEDVKAMIDQFPAQMSFVKKVMTLESLRKKHSQYAQRRALLKKYSVFMADGRIIPMLTSCLGKDFFRAKKHPIPVEVTRKAALPVSILNALSSTFLHLSEGNCVVVRAGFTHMTSDQLVDNVMSILDNGVGRIPRKWANIRAIAVKTPNSMSLPFYNKTPAELAEIARLAGISQVWKDDTSTPKEGDNIEAMVDASESPKKRKELKSPLVQALKKQKKIESDTNKGEEANNKVANSETSTKEHKNSKKEIAESEELTNKPKKTRDELDDEDAATTAKQAKKDEAEKSTKKQKKKKESSQLEGVKDKKDEKSTRKKRKSDAANVAPEESSKKPTGEFIASKTFTGSEKGYVFRQGAKGLGYYMDIKPVPDKAALAALARMHNQGKVGNERRKSTGGNKPKKGGKKSKGRRSF